MNSTPSGRGLTRRAFLALPALIPAVAYASAGGTDEHFFQYDYVLGTSLDLVVWTTDADAAAAAERSVLEEIGRLSRILNTRDPESEISLMEGGAPLSRELESVLAAYSRWNRETQGVISLRPRGPESPRNVDALGKAFILDRAVHAAYTAARGIDGVLLNIGGDLAARGRPCEIAVANPHSAADNAPPLTRIRLHNAAAATSGSYARGAHLIDARTGESISRAAGATVVAPSAVTANALATALCVADEGTGMPLVERISGAEALRIDRSGTLQRTSGFSRIEIPALRRTALAADWPTGYELNIALTLINPAPGAGPGGRGGRGPAPGAPAGPGGARGPGGPAGLAGPGGRGGPGGAKRLYVAVWIENSAGKLVRVLAFWADKTRYYTEMSTFFGVMGRNQNALYAVARATRAAGSYTLVWDGLDDQQKPVPPGSYKVVVETNREHGVYAKQAVLIQCGDSPASATLPATGNFEAVTLQYGPKPKAA